MNAAALIAGRLKAIRERKGRIVVVDPRRTETADIADTHHFIHPGTNALFVAALINVLFAERKVKLGRVTEFTDGLDALQRRVGRFAPDAVAPHCGIAAETIHELALEFAAARSAIARCRMGISPSSHSTLSAWLVYAPNVVTGNLDSPGGVMFTKPEGTLHDWEILVELSTRLSLRDAVSTLTAKATRTVVSLLGDKGMVDRLLRLGPYGKRLRVADRLDGLSLKTGFSDPLFRRMRHRLIERMRENPVLRQVIAVSPYGTERNRKVA